MNCDRLARFYKLFEYAAFARKLERHRFHFLPECRGAHCALVLGDGDGRFLTRLARMYPHLEVDCIELSPRMAALAQERLARAEVPHPERIQFYVADARTLPLAAHRYDMLISHFFLDCFSTAEVNALCNHIAPACVPGAQWILTEFQQPAHGWRAVHARIWLTAMYTFFRVATRLEVSTLPQYRQALEGAGFRLQARHSGMAGLIASERWQRAQPSTVLS